jgi:hypothetical protein
MHARRAETIALLDQVLEQCGVWTTDDFATIINDEYCASSFLASCRATVAVPRAAAFDAPAAAAVRSRCFRSLQVAVPPPPPTVTVVLQIAVPRVPTTETGTLTANCRTRDATAQTARRLYGISVEAQTEAEPSVVEAHAAELEAAEQRASSEQTLRQAAEQTAAAMTTAWMDAERAHTAAETARAAAEGALADALAAHGDTGRVEMVAASTNTKYLVDGVGLASTGTQTTMHVLSPHRHFPTAPPLPMPRSSTPPPHHLPPRPPSPLTPSMPQSYQPSDAPPPAPYPTDQSDSSSVRESDSSSDDE